MLLIKSSILMKECFSVHCVDVLEGAEKLSRTRSEACVTVGFRRYQIFDKMGHLAHGLAQTDFSTVSVRNAYSSTALHMSSSGY